MSVEDFGAILSPFVAYFTKIKEGLPVADHYRCAAVADRPDIGDQIVPAGATLIEAQRSPEETEGGVRLVRVVYEAVEEDWLSANDQVKREGSGMICLDQGGRPVVITCRSICDGGYFIRDAFGGDAEIGSEAIRVIVPGGEVLRAGRTWVDPEGRDLAVLTLEGAGSGFPVTDSNLLEFSGQLAEDANSFRVAGSSEALKLTTVNLPAMPDNCGAVCFKDNKVVAILGQKDGIDVATELIPLALIPAGLRPRQ